MDSQQRAFQVSWLRRRWIIHTRAQMAMLLFSFGCFLFGALFIKLTEYFIERFSPDPLTPGLELWPTLIYFAIGMLFFVSVVAYQLRFTNRIFGPLYRLRNHMLNVAKGEESGTLQIRDRDFHNDLVESYNQVLRRLQKNSPGH